jgi:hypothetical protein
MNDHIAELDRARYLAALGQEDSQLSATIAAIREDQKLGYLSDAEAVGNIAAAEQLHAAHCGQLADTYQDEVQS